MLRVRSILTVLLLLVAACGQSTASAQELVLAAATTTQEAGSARFTMTQTIEGDPPLEIVAEGAMDFAAQQGTMSTDLGEMAAALGEAPSEGTDATVEMLFDGTVVYLRLPDPDAPTEWLKIDASTMPGMEGMASFDQLANEPAAGLGYLHSVGEDVEELGTEEVRGEPTTHYRFTADLRQAIDDAPEDLRPMLEQQVEMLGVTEFPVEVWIDDAGRVRRQTSTIDVSQAEGLSGEMTMTMEFYDFGLEVSPEFPPDEDVTDLSELMGQ